MQTESRDRIGRGKLPSGKDRLHDFKTVRNPVDALQQGSLIHARSWRHGEPEEDLRLYSRLSETHERERIADLGEVVHRAIVNISPDRFVYVVFGPNRAIREPNLSSDGQLPAVSRIFLTTAVTRYASSRLKEQSREENGSI